VVKSVPKADAAGESSEEKAQHSTVRETPSAKGRTPNPSKPSRRASAAAREVHEQKKKRRKHAIVEVMLADTSKDRRREDD
jgi:hypothetical protein